MSATPAWLLPIPRSAAASIIAIVAWPRSSWARRKALSAAGPTTTIVAAECATWPAPRQTVDSSRSCSRSVTRTKSHGCQFCEDGDRRPASRTRSRSAAGIGRSVNDRTLRREVMASQVCMLHSYPCPEREAAWSIRQPRKFSRVSAGAGVDMARRRSKHQQREPGQRAGPGDGGTRGIRAEFTRAASLTRNAAERAVLLNRAAACSPGRALKA